MNHETFRPRTTVAQVAPREPSVDRPIGRAVLLLMTEHGVTEAAAYEWLVHASADSRTSVRDTAIRLLTSSN